MITDETHEALFTGDTFGSGFIWALFETNGGNPLAALDKGCSLARKILNNNPSLSILADLVGNNSGKIMHKDQMKCQFNISMIRLKLLVVY